MNYDSTADTLLHIKRVSTLLNNAAIELIKRGSRHDDSKLLAPEKEHFDRETPILKDLVFGTDGFKESLSRLKVALNHHYANNSHHPQYYDVYKCRNCGEETTIQDTWLHTGTIEKNRFHNCLRSPIFELELMDDDIVIYGVNRMNLFDIIEMFFDWKAAGERNKDGNMYKSVEINKDRFKMSDQLADIFNNTSEFLGYEKP